MQRLIPFALLVSAGALVGFGCGGQGFTQEGGGSAGASGAGMSAGGNSGGGGAANGGGGIGGVGIGGVSTGGSGGTAQGGSSKGGSAGAPPMTCATDSDCVDCRYPTAPTTKQQCYCASCANTPMTKAACDTNDAAYNAVCADVHLPCPAIACIMPKAPVCKNQMCVAGQ